MGSASTDRRVVSLRVRFLLAGSLVLAGFVLACAAALDHVFEDRARQSLHDRLQGLAYALLAASEPTADGNLSLSSFRLPDARLQNPGSGLEAALIDPRKALAWGSVSLSDDFPLPPPVTPGQWAFEEQENRFVLAFGLRWLNPLEGEQHYTLLIMEGRQPFREQMRGYRRTLWLWLSIAALGLLFVQGLILGWGLVPLRRLRRELRRVEQGKATALEGAYPIELHPLTGAINGMLQTGQAQLARQRNALDDLAHSLKTPLAVLRGLSEDPHYPEAQRHAIAEPVSRIYSIVDHQLRLAALAGRRTLTEPIGVRDIAEKIARSLAKVYAAQSPTFEWALPEDLRVRMDSGDCFELLGNLMDNAVKYGGGQVRISGTRRGRNWTLRVEDNGPGFPPQPERLLERGVRADQRVSGQGIGLAATREVVLAYEGKLSLGRSERLGGACIEITLPG